MNKIITVVFLILISSEISYAQYAYFSTRGTISYDKTVYTRAKMRDMQQNFGNNTRGGFGGGRMFDIENVPESSTEKYILEFDENSTLMYNQTESSDQNKTRENRGSLGRTRGATRNSAVTHISSSAGITISPGIRPNNSSKILAQNLKNSTTEVQIQIDDKYIITDSINEITWRFSDEYRNIAGYECRRVNGATNDSLYIIAFYTDEIPISAGPALTGGLPGMILGLVIPEMHIQYWATKVEYSNNIINNQWKDKKAKPITLDEFISSFGRFFQRGRDSNSSKRQVQEQLLY